MSIGLRERALSRPQPIQRKRVAPAAASPQTMPRGRGEPLGSATRAAMSASFNHDFSGVRTFGDRDAGRVAESLGAAAFASGRDIVFAPGRQDPHSAGGRELLAHELAHVVQQAGGQGGRATGGEALEAEADRAASLAAQGRPVPFPLSPAGPDIQCRVELRDVGRGESSGVARLPELADRLNAISTALIFDTSGGLLTYVVNPYGDMTEFDREMIDFIDAPVVLPLRITTREARLRDGAGHFTQRVIFDAWAEGYVDIDDLLASSDLGLQAGLLHFLTERARTAGYARRIGSPGMDPNSADPATRLAVRREFVRAHQRGVDAEVALLRDFFSDPTIREVRGAASGNIFRVYINDRRDHIRMRVTEHHGRTNNGVDAVSIEVVTRDGHVHTPEEYLVILRAARPAAPAPAPAPAP